MSLESNKKKEKNKKNEMNKTDDNVCGVKTLLLLYLFFCSSVNGNGSIVIETAIQSRILNNLEPITKFTSHSQ